MKLVLDENIERSIAVRLRTEGHDVSHVASISPRAEDGAVLALALRMGALVITGDKDFGQLVFESGARATGIVLVRLTNWPADRKADLLATTLTQYGESLLGQFSVLDSMGLRQKRLPRH